MATSATSPTTPSTGESTTTATMMISAWASANTISGAASRRANDTSPTSVVAREVRSPVPAPSTARAGSRIEPVGQLLAQAGRGPFAEPVTQTAGLVPDQRAAAAADSTTRRPQRSMVATPAPACTSLTICPSSHGPTRPAPAAAQLVSSTTTNAARSERMSRHAARRTSTGLCHRQRLRAHARPVSWAGRCSAVDQRGVGGVRQQGGVGAAGDDPTIGEQVHLVGSLQHERGRRGHQRWSCRDGWWVRRSTMVASVAASRAEVGSTASRTVGSAIVARASRTRWR